MPSATVCRSNTPTALHHHDRQRDVVRGPSSYRPVGNTSRTVDPRSVGTKISLSTLEHRGADRANRFRPSFEEFAKQDPKKGRGGKLEEIVSAHRPSIGGTFRHAIIG